MARKPNFYETNTEEQFLSSAITELKQGLTTYIYKEKQLEKSCIVNIRFIVVLLLILLLTF